MTATGQTCDAKRQEFILLSDVLGVSMLVNAMNHHSSRDATVSTILGPVYVSGAKDMEHGADISGHQPSQPTFISGKVCDLNGRPIESAVLDVWHVRPDQRYDVQDSGAGMQFRGKFCTGKDSCYAFRTILPVSYPVPPDGPVGLLLNRTGRHPFRPAHVHFIVSAPGYEQVITNLFVTGDPYLDSDAVFGVKNSLVVEFTRNDSADEAKKLGVQTPFFRATYDFSLAPAAASTAPRTPHAADEAIRPQSGGGCDPMRQGVIRPTGPTTHAHKGDEPC